MDCHHYSENHHPVNIVPKKTIPDGFPLYDGRMKCLTCHEAHGNQKRAYPKLLRGAPYKELRDMCFACHPPTSIPILTLIRCSMPTERSGR